MRPEELVEVDSTPLDLMVFTGDDTLSHAELTDRLPATRPADITTSSLGSAQPAGYPLPQLFRPEHDRSNRSH